MDNHASRNRPALQARNLTCARGNKTLFRDLHFTLHPGEMLHIRGANGVGKTSLLQLLCGLSAAQTGEVLWRGNPVGKCRPDYHAALAYLGHRPPLSRHLTAPQNLAALHALAGRAVDEDEVIATLRRFELSDCLHLPVANLSAGQRRRVALAGIAMRLGGIWILDEPAAELDAAAVQLLQQTFAAQLQAGGMIIFSSHRELTVSGITPQRIDLEAFE